RLSMCGAAPHFFRGQLNGGADAPIRHAAAQVPTHNGINVLITGVWVILEQRRCLHDLPGLTVAALRCLRLDPGLLQRMATLGIESFDRGDLRSPDRTDRGDAGADG